MADCKDTMLLHLDALMCLRPLSMEQRGAVLTALIAEHSQAMPMPDLDTCAEMAYCMLSAQVEREYARYQQRCQKRREAAEARWAAARAAEGKPPRGKAFTYMQRPETVDAEQFVVPLDAD